MSQSVIDRATPRLPRLWHPGHALLRRLLARLACGSLTVTLPDGSVLTHRAEHPGPDAAWTLHNWRALRRLILGGDIGFAESFIDSDWSSPDLTALIELAARNHAEIPQASRGSLPVWLVHRLRHLACANTRAGSRRNIMRHYDLGNDFYAAWLDSGMTYSAALFEKQDASLEDAQTEKQDRILDLLALQPGMTVLEIGCGWGGLAERIAAAGCHVTALTLSPAQHAYATRRLGQAGLAGNADIRLQDYRDATGRYDRIVSIEMLEAVGQSWWPTYFQVLGARLRQHGRVVLQSITIDDASFDDYRSGADFIQRYIFPGGMLPSPSMLRHHASAGGFALRQSLNFGAGYARTLQLWRDRFHAAWPDTARLGFPPSFRRLWDYYLCYCEAGFRAGRVDVGLFLLDRA
jgi:cyclopropane-fatty-acyl-phospholipid synthase